MSVNRYRPVRNGVRVVRQGMTKVPVLELLTNTCAGPNAWTSHRANNNETCKETTCLAVGSP